MGKLDNKPALIIVDAQKGIDEAAYWGGDRNNPDAEQNIKRLLDQWRTYQYPIFHIQHLSIHPESPFWPAKEGSRIKEIVKPISGETLIQKTGVASAFINTALQKLLEEKEIKTVVITGFITNNSVEATARMAGHFGFITYVVADATATFTLQGWKGEKYAAELIHAISLSNLNGEYATIVKTQEVIQQLN